ncbi:hypothetical protein PM082_021552 [Marasmius tenuissimus]|nr:hypothetical protein PM082_021552 [Marasmius tenuissimus]
MEDTVDKFDLRKDMKFDIERLGLRGIHLVGNGTSDFTIPSPRLNFVCCSATVLISGVGGISFPRDIKFEGMETFKGEGGMLRTMRWNHNYDYRGKRGSQLLGTAALHRKSLVPVILRDGAGFVKQCARSPTQWCHERPNRDYTQLEKWCFEWIPLWQKWLRMRMF